MEYFSHTQSEAIQSYVHLLISASQLFSKGDKFAQDTWDTHDW